ncbi:MAG: hypothetical protein AB7N76_10470 [Planctomycetota bacterium]
MQLRLPGLLVAAAAIVVASTGIARAERVDGAVAGKPVAGTSHYILTLEGQGEFKVPPALYDRYKKKLEALNPGDPIEFDAEADRTITEFHFAAEVRTVERIVRDGVFDRFEATQGSNGRLWLQDGQNFRIEFDKLRADCKAFWATIQVTGRGKRIRLELERDLVISVEKGFAKGEEEKEEVRELLQYSMPGDAPIQLRTKSATLNAKLISKQATTIDVAQLVPGANPPIFKGRLRVRRSEILELLNPAGAKRLAEAKKREGGGTGEGGAKKDPFDAAGAVVGDTIGIGFESGQLIALGEDTYTLCGWRNGRWESDPKPKPRKGVPLVRHVELVSQSTVPLEGGDLELTLKRSRRQNPGTGQAGEPAQGLCFEVTLNHSVKDLILVDLKLQFNLSTNPCMGLKQKPDKVVTRDLGVPLFANQRQTVRQEIGDDGLLDGQLEVVVYPRNLVKIGSKQARGHLIAVMGTNQDVEALSGVYQAAAVNGDHEMCELMIARELQLRAALQAGAKDESVKAHELYLRQALDAFGPVAPKLILDTLFELDRTLKTWGFRQGQIVQLPLPPKERPQTYKRKLIELLSALPRGMEEESGARLFDLYLRRADDFKEDIVAAYGRRPEEAVACLLAVAVDIKQRERAEKATILLRDLGQRILGAIFNELPKREIDPGPFRTAQKEGKAAEDIVAAMVDALVRKAYAQRKQELDDMVAKATSKRAARSYDEALAELREVINREPNHAEAHRLLPEVLIDKAILLREGGKRGAAALCLLEAADELKGPARAKADVPLGEMLVEATEEELDSISVRAAPHAAAESIQKLTQGSVLDGEDPKSSSASSEWLQVTLPTGGKGYVRKGLVAPMGEEGKWQVTQGETPYTTLKEQLDKAEQLAPAVGPKAKEVLGRLSAREGVRRYDSGDFKNALAFFNTAAQYAPTDPRLELRWKCWIQSNTGPLVGVAAVLVFVVGIVLMQVFSRPTKVKFSGEYKHYGAERNVRERDLEVE